MRRHLRCDQSLLPALKRGRGGGARLQRPESLKKRAGCLRGSAERFRGFCHWSPIIPLSTGLPAFPKPLTRRTLNPSQAATERPSRKAKAQGGFPEARTARNESRLACFRDGCRDLRVPRKACQRRRRTDAAMKAGKNLRWHAGRSPQGWRSAWSGTGAALGWRLAGPSKSRLAWRDDFTEVAALTGSDLTGRRWEKSRRRLSFWG